MKKVFTLESDPSKLESLRGQLKDFLDQTGFPPPIRDKILVCVGEACTNSIRHSYQGQTGQKIEVTAEDFEDRLTLRIRDFGQKIDLAKVKTPKLPPTKPGGLGVYFMKTIMDKMEYNTGHSEGNELILTKYKEKGEKTP